MKRFLMVCLVFLPFFVAGQSRLQAYLSYVPFLSPTDGPYLETYLAVDAASLNWVEDKDGMLNASLEVTLLFWQDSTIVNFKKYDLEAPTQKDSSTIGFSIIDAQRFVLPNGSYNMEIKLRDKAAESKSLTTYEEVLIHFPESELSTSGIELLDTYKKTVTPTSISKSGFDLVPYVFTYFPDHVNDLKFYSEIYNADKLLGDSAGFLVNIYLQSYEQGGQISSTLQRRRMVAMPINAVISEIDISELPSGNYYVIIELRDRENNLIGLNKQFFQRNNPDVRYDIRQLDAINTQNTFVDQISDQDSLLYFIRSIYPIATEVEKVYTQNGLKADSPDMLRKYFYAFWASRYPENPESGWKTYKSRLLEANKLYATPIKAGFETDRGRVYLQYGEPNTRVKEYNEPSAYPYEIWHYYTLQNQSNRKFVFYNPDLVTNDFELIHSDAIGEVYNTSWQMMIFRRDTPSHNLDDTGDRDQYGSKSREYLKNPY